MESSPLGGVQVALSGISVRLLMQLMEMLHSQDGAEVISRALGLLHLTLHATQRGQKVVLQNPVTGQQSEIAP